MSIPILAVFAQVGYVRLGEPDQSQSTRATPEIHLSLLIVLLICLSTRQSTVMLLPLEFSTSYVLRFVPSQVPSSVGGLTNGLNSSLTL